MTPARRPRRVAALAVLAAVVAAPFTLAACGSGSADLTVKVTYDGPANTPLRAGDDAPYHVKVVNHGPGTASAVTIRVDLPPAFRYKSTPTVNSVGPVARTQPSDPPVDSADPTWGQWTLGPPGTNADGTPAIATLDISFTLRLGGRPGTYTLVPHVFSESSDEVVGQGARVQLSPASDLSLSIAVDTSSQVKRGDTVRYHVTVLNKGSGPAEQVGVLVTLPSGLSFSKTEHLDGNFSRHDAVDPVVGAVLVYYGGWNLPAATDVRPGTLTIIFSAKVLPTAFGGRYGVSAQLTDKEGNVVSLGETAQLSIVAPTATPVPSATPSATRSSSSSTTTTTTRRLSTPTPTPKKH